MIAADNPVLTASLLYLDGIQRFVRRIQGDARPVAGARARRNARHHQRMINAATTKPPAFDVILVHSFSRFFRDQFQLELYVRLLAKNGARLVSITQEL